MSYNRKTTDYALLPNGPFPLDSRSHFEDFAEAYNTVTSDLVGTVETANQNEFTKRFYVGQIITTTNSGTWQVCHETEVSLYIYSAKVGDATANEVRWGGYSAENKTSFYGVLIIKKEGFFTGYIYLDGSKNKLITSGNAEPMSTISNMYKTTIKTCLIPFNGSGSGGGALTINATAPLNYNLLNSTLSLSIDTDHSPLTVKENKLTLSINDNSGLALNDNKQLTLSTNNTLTINSQNQLSLNIDSNGGLKQNASDGSIYVEGAHITIEKSGSVDAIKVNNYIYQKI